MADTFSVMCFAWNASGLKLCETMSRTAADAARKGIRGFVTLKQPCVTPDFFEVIRGYINDRRPSLVVMSTEDEDSSGTYFHSDLLPKGMKEVGYGLLKRDKLPGIGEAAALVPQLRVPSGKPSGSALRVSIYAQNELLPGLRIEEKLISNFFPNNGMVEKSCAQGNHMSGAIGTYVWHERYGKFLFISAHLVAGINALRVGVDLDYKTYRMAARAGNSLCLISMMDTFVDSVNTVAKPDHIFLLGDLNYDIVVPGKEGRELLLYVSKDISANAMRALRPYDELTQARKEIPLLDFKEGVNDQGPLFAPTWKLNRNRGEKCVPGPDTTKIETGCFADIRTGGGAGWHDRILYKDNLQSNYVANCVEYNRLDIMNMHASSHAGVTALFEMRSIQ